MVRLVIYFAFIFCYYLLFHFFYYLLLCKPTRHIDPLGDGVVDAADGAGVGAGGVEVARDARLGVRAQRVGARRARLAEHARVRVAAFCRRVALAATWRRIKSYENGKTAKLK